MFMGLELVKALFGAASALEDNKVSEGAISPTSLPENVKSAEISYSSN